MATILIIDDDELVRYSMMRILTRAGHQVIQIRDGAAARAICECNTVDIVVSDVVMPEKEGIELIRQLRRHCPQVAVIAISARAPIGDASYFDVARRLGATTVLAKPFEDFELLEAVRRCDGR